MADKSWKRRERQAARWFGSERVIGSGCGAPATSASDSTHAKLFIETKLRKRHTAARLWDSVKAKAEHEDKVPIVAMAEHGRPGFWLLIRSGDFETVLWERLKTLYGNAATERARQALRRV